MNEWINEWTRITFLHYSDKYQNLPIQVCRYIPIHPDKIKGINKGDILLFNTGTNLNYLKM